jgi:hypothetical protein
MTDIMKKISHEYENKEFKLMSMPELQKFTSYALKWVASCISTPLKRF